MIILNKGVRGSRWLLGLLVSLSLGLAGMHAHAEAKPKLILGKVSWSAKQHKLVVKGQLKHGSANTPIEIFDLNGRRLGPDSTGPAVLLKVDTRELSSIPCAVRVQAGSLEAVKKVVGAPKSCLKGPLCQILSPAPGTQVKANEKISFQAQASVKDKQAGTLKTEWDFAGGVLQTDAQRMNKLGADGLNTEAVFVRDNSRYRVRFSATDAKNRRCEDSVEVIVGNPPTGLPDVSGLAQAAQQSQPKLASGLQGNRVVLPFEDWSMQCGTDGKMLPDGYYFYGPEDNTISAYVYEKGLRPVPLGPDKIDLRYAAASNASDPVGAKSINATSQNWPTDVSASNATLYKSDYFERYQRPPGSELASDYQSLSLIDSISGQAYGGPGADYVRSVDEGARNPSSGINTDHGRYMPGYSAPYVSNEPQSFSSFDASNNWFSAFWMPVTDIDDSGQVNPYPLFRVQAMEPGTQNVVAATDTVVTSGRDVHCRGCHAEGQIAANPNITRINQNNDTTPMFMPADSSSIPDQEYAASQNAANLHMFNMGMGGMSMPGTPGNPVHQDGPTGCGQTSGGMCHGNALLALFNGGTVGRLQNDLSMRYHQLHALLQYNADKSDVERDANGFHKRWDPAQGPNPNPLFPFKDAQGKPLPMEQNCLQCHSGQREQCYRDRMYTAGVTCYQCHGDMLAVGKYYKRSKPNRDGNPYREDWFDQPNCGSCHTGSGNVGKDASNGYFSAGVKNLAFDKDDPSATPIKPDLFNPDESRFAVVPISVLDQNHYNDSYNSVLQTPLFRLGKDPHGNVACAACHGAAHSIWPIRDPGANDNLTSLELQGHTGTVLDCNVCHTSDSFQAETNLDAGRFMQTSAGIVDVDNYVLGGPHNLHPVNDPYWWKSSATPSDTNKDGTSYGGWHNNYAKRPGQTKEDQCAACHGNDHLGTRLSKAPVDRVFDFSDVPASQWARMKKAGFKSKIIKVAAGAPIGCNTCHSVNTSCLASPNPRCGQPSDQVTGTTNQPPVVSTTLIPGIIGTDVNFRILASDAEGDAISFARGGREDSVGFVASDGTFTLSGYDLAAMARNHQIYDHTLPPYAYDFTVVATDSKGAYSVAPITVSYNCPDGLSWDVYNTQCAAVAFTFASTPAYGLNGGNIWTFDATAVAGSGSTLTYTLDPLPPMMSIDGKGHLAWNLTDAGKVPSDVYSTTVKVKDALGNEADLPLSITICQPPMTWSDASGTCNTTVQITSTAPAYVSHTSNLSYVENGATDSTPNATVSYSLNSAPPRRHSAGRIEDRRQDRPGHRQHFGPGRSSHHLRSQSDR